MIRHQTDRGTIYEARAEDVYPLLSPGSVTLVHCDGPYAHGVAEWDSMKLEDLPDWYRPHIASWDAICAASASTYVWGTDSSASILRPEMKAAGWTWRTRITWDKSPVTGSMSWRTAKAWPEATEVCDFYTRGDPYFQLWGPASNVWHGPAAGFKAERLRSGKMVRAAKNSSGGGSGLKAEPLHKCQKPLEWSRRVIRASCRPASLVLSPFGGTCRDAVVCESLSPAEARRYVCVEVNDDGVDYLAPAIEELEAARGQAHLFSAPGQEVEGGTDPEPVAGHQPSLFG